MKLSPRAEALIGWLIYGLYAACMLLCVTSLFSTILIPLGNDGLVFAGGAIGWGSEGARGFQFEFRSTPCIWLPGQANIAGLPPGHYFPYLAITAAIALLPRRVQKKIARGMGTDWLARWSPTLDRVFKSPLW